MMNTAKQASHQAGFTLIELVMTLIILSVISVVIAQFLLQAYTLFVRSQNIADVDFNGFIALERMADDIHTIRSASDITTISSSQLTFTDINGNSVQYQLSGSTLQRNAITLASNVQSLTLGYKDANDTTTATASAVRYISISATLAQNNLTTTFSTLVGTRGMQ